MRVLRPIVKMLLVPALLAPVTLVAQRPGRPPTHIQFSWLHENFTVLFQGDSITDGGRQKVGNDQNHVMGQDYAYIVAAEIGADIPDRNVRFSNRGVSGERVVDLAARWHDDALALKPDVLSILVGINDTMAKGDRAETVEEFEAAYDKLLAQTVAALPNARIVLGVPFLLPVGKHQAAYEDELKEVKKRQAVVVRLGAKYHCAVIDYQEAFNDALNKAPAERWSWDGIHPTPAGHELMAREWMRVTNAAWASN